MSSNSFGKIFRMTTWGESHGKAMGVVIDGCPAGVSLSEEDLQKELDKRRPGMNAFVSPRKEKDRAEILSGVFEGVTTGASISILIPNEDGDSSKYEAIKHLYRPGHANYTYLKKYGVFDYRGGGRSSARETVCRVAAGAVAGKILETCSIKTCAVLLQVGPIQAKVDLSDSKDLKGKVEKSFLFCPDERVEEKIRSHLDALIQEGDSTGGVVGFCAWGLPAGLGDPVYDKLEAKLAQAMMSLPASKGFEIGDGFQAVTMKGSLHNDNFVNKTNHAGGVLGGISTSAPLWGKVAFKPTSSIRKEQRTLDFFEKEQAFVLPKGSRHDPCVSIRAVPIVEAMLKLVLVDSLLYQNLQSSSYFGITNQSKIITKDLQFLSN